MNIIFANSAQAAVSPSESAEKAKMIRELINKSTSKNEKKIINGVIQNIVKETIFVNTKDDSDIEIIINEETKLSFLSWGKKKNIILKDLKVGQRIIAWGELNTVGTEKPIKTFTVQKMLVKTLPQILVGTVKKIDPKNYILTVESTDKKEYTIEVEIETVIKKINEEKINLIGFSKIKEGDKIITQSVISITNADRYTPLRLIVL